MDRCLNAAMKLHRYLVDRHWRGKALIGPDPGIRFNYRIGRFLKSHLSVLDWKDDYYYLQAQGYWVLGNWRLLSLTGEEACRSIALSCSEQMLTQQQSNGAWPYPNPEWRGRVATAEGTWGSIGLLESYRQTGNRAFLEAALRWHHFVAETIGYQRVGDELAVNYFAGRQGSRVPNNSAFWLRFLAELKETTGDDSYLEPCAGLLAFMRAVQEPTGEFPYAVDGADGGKGRPHFQCYQYNAFQCLDLMRYHEITSDGTLLPMIVGLLGFLRQGLAEDGHALYDCGNRYRAVVYHAAVLGAAFASARGFGIDGYEGLANRAYSYVLGLQRPEGDYSRYSGGDYRLLQDRRSYPRYLAMILYHLLTPAIGKNTRGEEVAHEYVR